MSSSLPVSIAYATQIVSPGRLSGHRGPRSWAPTPWTTTRSWRPQPAPMFSSMSPPSIRRAARPSSTPDIKVSTSTPTADRHGQQRRQRHHLRRDRQVRAMTLTTVALEAIKAAGCRGPRRHQGRPARRDLRGRVRRHRLRADVNGDAIRDTAYIKTADTADGAVGPGDRPDRLRLPESAAGKPR